MLNKSNKNNLDKIKDKTILTLHTKPYILSLTY